MHRRSSRLSQGPVKLWRVTKRRSRRGCVSKCVKSKSNKLGGNTSDLAYVIFILNTMALLLFRT